MSEIFIQYAMVPEMIRSWDTNWKPNRVNRIVTIAILLVTGCTDPGPPTMHRIPVKPDPPETPEFTGKVIKVSDGDTITVLDDEFESIKIRFNGIDAPEKAQAFGDKARQALRDKIAGKTHSFEDRPAVGESRWPAEYRRLDQQTVSQHVAGRCPDLRGHGMMT
jgi:endonuclease YncB( thermonuclease family)